MMRAYSEWKPYLNTTSLRNADPSNPQRRTAMAQDMVAFFESWVAHEEQLVAELLAAPKNRDDILAPLVGATLEHVHSYYAHKSRLAGRDVVSALDPQWLNPLERTFLWAWGWKPALAFRFVDTAGVQLGAIEELQRGTAAEERAVEREVAAVQESLAGPRVLAALRRQPPRNGEVDEAVASVGQSLRVLLAAADALRERTVRRIVEMLSPQQAAAFLAALLQFHVSVRRAGRQWSGGAGAGSPAA